MEIASVALFESAGTEIGAAQEQSPRNGFKECLGAAVHRQHEAPDGKTAAPPPSRDARSQPAAEGPRGEHQTTETPSAAGGSSDGPTAETGADEVTAPPAEASAGSGKELQTAFIALGGVIERAPLVPPAIEEQILALLEGVPTSPAEEVGLSGTGEQQVAGGGAVSPPDGTAPEDLHAAAQFCVTTPAGEGQRPPSASDADASVETDGGGSQADVRRRAAGVFNAANSSERLWGFWLRNRANGVGPVAHGASLVGGETAEQGAESEARSVPLTNPATAASGSVEHAAVQPAPSTPDADGKHAAGNEKVTADAALAAFKDRAAPPQRGGESAAPSDRAGRPAPANQQVAQAARLSLARGGDRVTLQLEPESLGKVHVVLTRGEGGLTAQIRVESPLTQQALQADAPLLRQALEARGVNVAHVSVEMQQGEEQRRDAWGRHNGAGRRAGGFHGEDEEASVDEVTLRQPAWRPWGFEARI